MSVAWVQFAVLKVPAGQLSVHALHVVVDEPHIPGSQRQSSIAEELGADTVLRGHCVAAVEPKGQNASA